MVSPHVAPGIDEVNKIVNALRRIRIVHNPLVHVVDSLWWDQPSEGQASLGQFHSMIVWVGLNLLG